MIVLAMWMSACGGAPSRPSPSSQPAGFEGAMTDLLPENSKIAVIARPRELFRATASRHVIDAIIPDERFESYRQHTGIDPRELDELVWAEADDGSICVIRGPFNAPLAVAEMGRQMLPLESSSEEPFLRRGGHYAGARRDVLALSTGMLVAITGSPLLTRATLDRIELDRRDVQRTPSNLETASSAVFDMLRAHGDAPLIVIAPRPLGLPTDSGVGLLLSQERRMIVSATPEGPDAILLRIDLEGDFPPGADQNFRTLVESLAESDLGAALGMRDALSSLSIAADDVHVSIRATLPARVLAAGLRILFQAEISELISPVQ
jgi:hypothetical protein